MVEKETSKVKKATSNADAKTSSAEKVTSSTEKVRNNRGEKTAQKTSSNNSQVSSKSDKESLKVQKTSSKKWIRIVVAVVAVLAVIGIVLAIVLTAAPKNYSVIIQGVQDEHCAEGDGRKTCSGVVELPAEIDDKGVISKRTLEIAADGGGTLNGGAGTIDSYRISETEYAELKGAKTIDGAKKMISLQDKDKIRVTYNLTVRYKLSDKDRETLKELDVEYQRKLAEEKARKEQEEKERAEREAKEKLAKTPYTYTSSACGFQKDVYCLLLSDFSAGESWKERIQATFDDFISKTSNVTKSQHLIYIFQSAQCYQEKIDSAGLSVCQIPRGEIAVSMDGKGITWSYEKD